MAWPNFRGRRNPLSGAAGFALLAIVGLFLGEGLPVGACLNTPAVPEGRALQADQGRPFFASPLSPESLISENLASLRPCLPAAAGTPADSASEALVRPRACSKVERQGVLVTALILKKYLHFRESLSSP